MRSWIPIQITAYMKSRFLRLPKFKNKNSKSSTRICCCTDGHIQLCPVFDYAVFLSILQNGTSQSSLL